MRIVLDPGAPQPAELVDLDVFTALDVAVPGGTTAREVGAVLGGVGELDAPGEDLAAAHVRVRLDWLRETAHAEGAGPGWDEQFDAMTAYARSKGWVDEEAGTVRAHVTLG